MAIKMIGQVGEGETVSFFSWVGGQFSLMRGKVNRVMAFGGNYRVYFFDGRTVDTPRNTVAKIEPENCEACGKPVGETCNNGNCSN